MVSLVTGCNFLFPSSHFTNCRPFSFILYLLRHKNLQKVVSLSELCHEDSEANSVGFFSCLPISAPGMPGGSHESSDVFFLSYPTSLHCQIRSESVICWHLCSAASCLWLSIYSFILPQGLDFIQPCWSSASSWHVNNLGFPTYGRC